MRFNARLFALLRHAIASATDDNVYRSRALGHIWQNRDLNVIPTVQYAEPASYGFAIHTLPRGGTLATSTVGVKGDAESEKIWRDGMREVLEVAKPKTLIIYGGQFCDFDYGKTKLIELKANTSFGGQNGQ